MDLRQLTYLVAVSDAGGFRAAAQRLGIAQPTISKSVRALERELGVQLLRREARGTELTPAGTELVSRARELIAGFTSAREAVQRIGDGTEVLRIGMVSGIISAGELVPPIFDAFRERYPAVKLELDEMPFADQVTPLLEEAVDVAIVRGPLARGPLARREILAVAIAEEPRVLLVAASHELADATSVRAEDVLDLPTLPLAAPGSWSEFWQLDELRGGSVADPNVVAAGTVAEVQRAVAMHGVVISTPSSAVRLQPNPLIRAVPIEGAPNAVIGVACRRADRRAHVRSFLDTAPAAAAANLHLMPGATLPS